MIFVASDRPGIPIDHRIVLKPNATSLSPRGRSAEELFGTGTDPSVLRRAGDRTERAGPDEIYVRRFHFLREWNLRGLLDINDRLGIATQDPERRDAICRKAGRPPGAQCRRAWCSSAFRITLR